MQKHPDLPQAFADLGVEAPLLKALAKVGYEEPSEIQSELIPKILAGHDVLGQAKTGTGKTAAFGIPTLQMIDRSKGLQAICLVPTRELAVQVTGELRRLAEFSGLRIVAVYGGQKIQTQVHQLGKKPHFCVGTPGRVMDMMARGILDIRNVEFALLDEVDRMLDIGFRDDIKKILGQIRSAHQTVFVSATIGGEIRRLCKQYMNDAVEINVSRDSLTVEQIDQYFLTAERRDKDRAVNAILKHDDPERVIVFTNTKAAARKVAAKLFKEGHGAMEIHGDLIQSKREAVLDKFKKNRLKVLVATDLAARGIDVHNVTHIINYDLPPEIQVYVHRIGRTGRMGKRGKAVSLVTREEGRLLTDIEMLINAQIEEIHYPGYKPSPVRIETPVAPQQSPGEVLASRVQSSSGETSTDADGQPATKVRRTLGGRFKPSRRRR
ncbi:MAG: DEAD/DEAH box helicase [Planctomycetes bacterium]|nr:DEAD/DEAH box helicase [Planctomycetota bacterium]